MPAPYYCRPTKTEENDSELLSRAIVRLKDEKGMSYKDIAATLAERGIIMTRMAVCQRYLRWKRDGDSLERCRSERAALDAELAHETSAARRHELRLAAARLSSKINQLERRAARIRRG